MNLEAKLSALRNLVRWIDDNTRGIEIDGDRKQQIACACFDTAIEHQAAIALLCDYQLFGSVHAMMRILVEAVTRGLWILHCATDAELGRFEQGRIDKSFGVLTAEIEAAIGAYKPTLSQMKSNAWRAMNDFTHTGYIQVTRRYGEGTLGPNYPQEDLLKCINAAGAYGLIASVQLAVMAEQDVLVDAHLQKMKEFAMLR
jgi:hypothetical protein